MTLTIYDGAPRQARPQVGCSDNPGSVCSHVLRWRSQCRALELPRDRHLLAPGQPLSGHKTSVTLPDQDMGNIMLVGWRLDLQTAEASPRDALAQEVSEKNGPEASSEGGFRCHRRPPSTGLSLARFFAHPVASDSRTGCGWDDPRQRSRAAPERIPAGAANAPPCHARPEALSARSPGMRAARQSATPDVRRLDHSDARLRPPR